MKEYNKNFVVSYCVKNQYEMIEEFAFKYSPVNFDDVLMDAKKLGYAETNPLSDLNGDDVASKLKILSSLCIHKEASLVM